MAALFTAASSQRLRNVVPPLPSTGYPFTVGLWVRARSVGALATIFSFADTGTTNNYFSLGIAAAGNVRISAAAGGAVSFAQAAQMATTRWYFVLGRFIDATNRRIAVLGMGGANFAASQDTVSRAPAGLDTMTIGSLEASTPLDFWDGMVGELWLANADVQADGGAATASLLHALAFGGPFAFPHIAKSLVEYRAMRRHPTAGGAGAIIAGAGVGLQVWENVNGVGMGPHPPLPYWYVNPLQRKSLLPFVG
jgi:hypothetical protein